MNLSKSSTTLSNSLEIDLISVSGDQLFSFNELTARSSTASLFYIAILVSTNKVCPSFYSLIYKSELIIYHHRARVDDETFLI